MFFEIATAKEERKAEAVRGRSGSQIANGRTEPESDQKSGRRADECRAAAGLWRFFFIQIQRQMRYIYETAAGPLTAGRPHASKPVCFKLYAFALKIKWLTKFRQRIVKRKNAETIALRIRGGFSICCGIGGAAA